MSFWVKSGNLLVDLDKAATIELVGADEDVGGPAIRIQFPGGRGLENTVVIGSNNGLEKKIFDKFSAHRQVVNTADWFRS